MRFSAPKDTLAAALQTVQNVVNPRVTLPILMNVKIEAHENKVRLTTSDLDMSVSVVFEADVERGGGTTIPAKRFFGITRELISSDVRIDTDSRNVSTIKCGQATFKLNGLPEDEFPPLANLAETRIFTIKQGTLRDAIKKTSYAVSADHSRYVLNGLFFSFRENRLSVVGTDGRRLAMTDIDLEFPKSDECEFIMPFKCVSELSRLIGDEGDVRLLVSDSNIGIEIGSIRLISKRVDGTYPNYKQVIPTEVRERVKIERQPFIEALRRVSLLESDRNHSVKFTLTKNTMIISSVATDIGEAREELTVDYKGRDMVISFNPDFVMDPLRALPDEVVNIDLVDEMSAAAVKVESPFLYVMMPMRS